MSAGIVKNTKAATIVVRQSKTDDVTGSVEEQERKARAYAEREGWRVVAVHVERSTSGGKALAKRRGLLSALHEVEAGLADVLLVAYGNRLDRNGEVRREVARRVPAAGGRIVNADTGREVEFETADGFLTNSTEAMLDEHYRLQARERVNPAKQDSITRGVPIARLDRVPLGYSRKAHEPYTVNPQTAPLVRRAFSMRADGNSINEIRDMLGEAGFAFSYSAVQGMLASRVYLGEIAFAPWINTAAHESIIEPRLFDRAAEAVKPRNGNRPKSDRLLARLGVLRCASCGGRMVVATGGGRTRKDGSKVAPVYTYRCPPNGDCAARVSIMAAHAEDYLSKVVVAALREIEGASSSGIEEAALEADRTEAALAKATRKVLVLDVPEEEARATLEGLRQARDEARRRHEEAKAIAGFTITAAGSWEEMGAGSQRELLSTVLDSATVSKSVRGGVPAERIAVTFSEGYETIAARVMDEIAAAAAEVYAA